MKISLKKFTIIFMWISMSVTCVSGIENSVFHKKNGRQSKSYANETLSAEEYYEAGLRGELMHTKEKKIPLLLSSLKLVNTKTSGVNDGGIYKDVDGNIWFVKVAQYPINEYLGAKVMNLLVGPLSPEVEVLSDAPAYTASKLLPGFLPKRDVSNITDHKPIIGEANLDMAMDLIGLADRNPGNVGYINMDDRLESARVDFDHSFEFDGIDRQPREFFDLKALKSIIDIPDEMILYILGDAYNDLWEAGICLDYEIYKDFGSTLIARKHALKDLPSKALEYERLYNKIKNDPTIYTKKDHEQLLKVISDVYRDLGLTWAIGIGDLNIVQLMLDNDVEVNIETEWGSTPLCQAIMKNKIKIVRLLLDRGADVNVRTGWGSTPLIEAVFQGDVEIIRLLLDNGVDTNVQTDWGSTALFEALLANNIEIVRLLLDKGANANITDGRGCTLLYNAVQGNKVEIVHLLLEHGANVNDNAYCIGTWQPPLYQAIIDNNIELVRLLLDNGANANANEDFRYIDPSYLTPLHWAVGLKHLEIVHLLLDKGANINVTDYQGQTVLDYAKDRFPDIVSLLDERLDKDLMH